MMARVTEQRRLHELIPAGSLACPTSVTRKRTSEHRFYAVNQEQDSAIYFQVHKIEGQPPDVGWPSRHDFNTIHSHLQIFKNLDKNN